MPLREMIWHLSVNPLVLQIDSQQRACMVTLLIVYLELRLQVSLFEEVDFLNF
jgi:hypothetical protein